MPVALLSVAAHALGGVCIVMALAPLFPGGLRLHDHAGECPESAPVWRRCPKRALRARGGPTGRQAGTHGSTSYAISPSPRPRHGSTSNFCFGAPRRGWGCFLTPGFLNTEPPLYD